MSPPADRHIDVDDMRIHCIESGGLGHYPSDEDPEGFLKIVDGFLAKV